MVEAAGAADPVPQLDRPQPLLTGVGRDGAGQVALLVAPADLVLAGCGQELGCAAVRAPALGLSPGHERVEHLAATAGGDQVVAGLRRLDDPRPLGASAHARPGLIRVDDRAATHPRTDRGL